MELVKIENGQLLTSSLTVAEVFGKQHAHVLRDIKNLECSQEFRQSNFGESSYTNSQNREMPCYAITRDGLSFLVMGFTGKEAALWKEKYIKAFNEMEAKLKSLALHSYQIDDPIKRAEKWIEEQKQKLLLENKVENLSTALDSLSEWTSIIKVCQFNKVKESKFDWRKLKAKSLELGFEIKKAESRRFAYQNLYHVNVFKACYPQYNYSFLNK